VTRICIRGSSGSVVVEEEEEEGSEGAELVEGSEGAESVEALVPGERKQCELDLLVGGLGNNIREHQLCCSSHGHALQLALVP
jgi:hypothetical protein